MDDGPAGGAWQIDPDTRRRLRLDRVRAAFERGDWDEVVLEAEELLDEEPDHTEALFLLGEALLELGDWEVAREVYDHRVGLDGVDAPALVGLAVASLHLCDLPAAAEAAREAVRLDPGHAEGHHTLGLALERMPGRQGEALAEFSAAAHLEPERYPLPITLRHPDWELAIGSALERLHPRLRTFYEQVPFRIEELPDLAELRSADPPLSPTVVALYAGDPPDDEDPFDRRPDAMRLFARNLGRAGSLDGVVEDLAGALRDEALDWLGVDPSELEDAE